MSGHRHSASYRSSNAHCIAPQLSALQLAQSPDESINQRANRSIGITTEEMSASDAFRPLLFEPCLRSRLESVSETRFAYLARIRRWALANARTRLFSSFFFWGRSLSALRTSISHCASQPNALNKCCPIHETEPRRIPMLHARRTVP